VAGTYRLKKSGAQFWWVLKAGNGETILQSEMYNSKDGANTGIASCRRNSPFDANYSRLTATNNLPYFVLRAGNAEVIGTSETYSSTQARDNGIQSCKDNGPTAPTIDET